LGTASATVSHVDIAFAVSGERLPRDHSYDLWRALSGAAPTLLADPTVAVLPVRGASVGEGAIVLQRRGRLLMRIPQPSIDLALGLCGTQLDLAGAPVVLGAAKTRPLAPYATLYAHRVAADVDEEVAFMKQVTASLQALGVAADFIVGSRTVTCGPEGVIPGFSLMLCELSARQSLALQVYGIGMHRALGFGVFVGHK
jgi:CRISPR-associated protein Cas6